MALDINKLIADAKAARAAFAADKIKADALAKSIKEISDADKKFKTEAQNKLNYANTLQKSLANFEGALTIFAQQIARDGKLNPVDQKEFNRVLAQYKKTDTTYKTTIKQANAILAKAPTPVKVKTKNGEAVIPDAAQIAADKAAAEKTDTKAKDRKPDDFAGLLKTATEYITKLKGSDRKFLAKSLNDALGLKLPVSESVNPQDLLVAYSNAISQAQNRYNTFKDVYTLKEFLDIKKLETAAAKTAEPGKGPDITDYPVISSPTDVKKLINSVFQTNLNRDATDAEIKLLSPLLKSAQLNNPTYYKKTTINGKVAQIQYSGLDSGQWILDQITSNKDLNLKAELDTAKTIAPDLAKRLADKKIYDKLIADAKGDPKKITIANETTVYGRGLKELLVTIQSFADANGATNTPEELSTLAKTLFDKGIAANSAEASAEIDKAFKSGVGLVADQATVVKTIAANKKIYDRLITEAAGDPAKIAAANDTTEYGRGLKNIIAALQLKAKDNAAINTTEELTALAKKLYDQGITLDSNEGVAAVNAVLKTKTGLVSEQSVDLNRRLAAKNIYDRLITEAAGDPAKIAAANETTEYGRGLKEILTALQTKAKKSGAINTPEELITLAKSLYDKGIDLNSNEGAAAVDAVLKTKDGLVSEQGTDLIKLAADKKIYDKLIADAKGDPVKIAAANDTTDYGRGLKNIVTALQIKAKDNGAINTMEELTALAKSLYDKGISLESNEGFVAVGNVLKTKTGLVKDQPADLITIAANKKIYDKLIEDAAGDPVLIAQAKKTTAYGRGLSEIEANLKSQATVSGATNTPEELTALALDLYDTGINPRTSQGIARINSAFKYTADADTGKYKGTAGTTIASLQKVAQANGFDLQKNFGDQISGWLTSIANGEDIGNIKQQIRDVAKLGQPDSIKKLIDNGNDLTTIYKPYKTTMANVLEIQDSESINLNDPALRMAITPNGELNIYDYTKALRKDNRWQYTEKARSEVARATKQVLQDFGFMG